MWSGSRYIEEEAVSERVKKSENWGNGGVSDVSVEHH